MLHHLTIETDRECDSAELLDFIIDRAQTPWLVNAIVVVGGHVDRDAAAAERAIAKRDRAIRLLLDELGDAWWNDRDGRDVVEHLADPAVAPDFPADVLDTIRHVCGIDAPVEVES